MMPFEKGTFIVPNEKNPEYVKSARERFRFRWPIAGNYQIKDGVLSPVPMTGWRESYPAVHPDIPIQLAKIELGDEKALLAFAREHGALGIANLLPGFLGSFHAKKLLRQDRGAFMRYSECVGLTDRPSREAWLTSGCGDPLPWVWGHIRTLKFCLDLTRYIQDRDEEGVMSYLRKHQWNVQRHAMGLYPNLTVAVLYRLENTTWNKPGDDRKEAEQWTGLDFAKYLRRELINKNISGIRVAIEPVGKAEDSFFEFCSLIELAYWHLHNIVICGRMSRCKECGAFFVQREKREKFCPEPKSHGKSICSLRFHARLAMKRYRRKLKLQRKSSQK